jgi:dTDP-4-amino-4,6-dideoxygalactose transaminase
MNELTGAVALAQLGKLQDVVAKRRDRADALTGALGDLGPVAAPKITEGSEHSYWKYCLNVDSDRVEDGAVKLGAYLRERGIACAPRYIQKPAFRCEVLDEQRTFGASRWPFNLARPEAVDYAEANFPGTFKALRDVLVLPWNEHYTDEHVEFIASAVRDGAAEL